MVPAQNTGKWFSLTRRKMLGSLFVGLAAVLTNFRLNTYANSLSAKGRILLDHLSNSNKGVEEAIRMPLIEALMGRRARRFSPGASIPDGPLKFTSQHKPTSLNELEQIMLLTAISGNTGWLYLHPFNKNYLPNIPNYAAASGGRTFPSSAGFHTSEIFYTDDNGSQRAEQGQADGQYYLGLMYALGKGLPRDYQKAAMLFRKAAEHGYADAQFDLGRLYAVGDGVEQDIVEAYILISLAASQGHKKAIKTRDLLALAGIAAVLTAVWLWTRPRQTDLELVKALQANIGSGVPVLLEIQSPY